jgi:hypothetical protein
MFRDGLDKFGLADCTAVDDAVVKDRLAERFEAAISFQNRSQFLFSVHRGLLCCVRLLEAVFAAQMIQAIERVLDDGRGETMVADMVVAARLGNVIAAVIVGLAENLLKRLTVAALRALKHAFPQWLAFDLAFQVDRKLSEGFGEGFGGPKAIPYPQQTEPRCVRLVATDFLFFLQGHRVTAQCSLRFVSWERGARNFMNWELQLSRPVSTRHSGLPEIIRTLGDAVDMVDEHLPESLRISPVWQQVKDMLVTAAETRKGTMSKPRRLCLNAHYKTKACPHRKLKRT